jgi:hypothetical protein
MMRITGMAYVSIVKLSLKRCHVAWLYRIQVGKLADTGNVLETRLKSKKCVAYIQVALMGYALILRKMSVC